VSSDTGPDVARAREVALELLGDAPEGSALDAATVTLVSFAVASAPTTLNRVAMRQHAERALELGVTLEELAEATLLASAIGVHGLHEAPKILRDVVESGGEAFPELDAETEAYRRRLLDDPYWQRLNATMPGRIDALLQLSNSAFHAFVDYVAVPWKTGSLSPKTKELIYVAIDTMPTHRYLPGMRFHIENALALGTSRQELIDVLDISAAAGPGHGVE